jgi:hypothetical protein
MSRKKKRSDKPKKSRISQRIAWRDQYSIPNPLEITLARSEICPKCLGELQDDLICAECCFDALDIVIYPEMFP